MGFEGPEQVGKPAASRACRLPLAAVTAMGLAAVAAVTALDWWTGGTAGLSVLSVFAVLGVAWCSSTTQGLAVAAAAAAGSLLADISAPGIWSSLALLGVLAATALLPGRIRAALADQAEAAATDPLTGALNRRAFQEAAERERLRAERRGEPLSVAYIDLDGFKQVNDKHGHKQGDRLLEELADRVLRSIRGTDLFCRIGGDEFVLLLPDTDAREAAAVLQRTRRTMGGPDTPVTSSVGIATFRIVPTTVGAMVEAADDLMYRAKEQGKDRIVGAVVGGPWLRWEPATLDGVVDTVTVDVEILPA